MVQAISNKAIAPKSEGRVISTNFEVGKRLVLWLPRIIKLPSFCQSQLGLELIDSGENALLEARYLEAISGTCC